MDNTLKNAAVNKLAPTIKLTSEQEQLVKRILHFCQLHLQQDYPALFTIYGDAGTGKSVVLSHLFTRLQTAARTKSHSPFYQTENYFTVNHPEILKVYRELAGQQAHQFKKDYQRPTSLINKLNKGDKKIDIVIVDEAHLLLSQPDHYNNFYQKNQLLELLRHAKVVVLVFDQFQVLRMKSLWTPQRLQQIVQHYPHADYHLHHQFRMTASDDLVDWFNHLTEQQCIEELPVTARDHYDFRVYDDAEAMRQAIVRRNHEVGLSRILSTSGYPSTLDGGKHYINEGRFHLPWDQYNFTSTPWAEKAESIDEVGSIYTCQGFDLNYAGIIIGPIFYQVPQSRKIDIDFAKYTDTESLKRRQDLTDPALIKEEKYRLILNALNVILKRGVYGTYLYAHDPLLRATLSKMFVSRGWDDVLNQ